MVYNHLCERNVDTAAHLVFVRQAKSIAHFHTLNNGVSRNFHKK